VNDALDRGILRSDLLRTAILASTLAIMLSGNLAVALITPDGLPPAVRANAGWMVVLAACAFTYEGANVVYLRRAITRGRSIPAAWHFVNVAVEMSFPTLVMIALAGRETEGAVLLHGPTPFVYFVLILLSTLHLDPRVCVFAGAVGASMYGGLALHYLGGPHHASLDPLLLNGAMHVGKAAVILAAGLIAAFVAHQLRRRFDDAMRVVAVFGQHVSPAVADRVLGGAGDAERRRVCVMFLDVRGFTAYASGRPPEEVMAYLNSLFGEMIELVERHGGIINKFLGDGFMAVFGAPMADERAVAHAVDCALAIARTVATRDDATRIGIGLHAGDAMTGTVGSPLRKEYTVIGDVVNLASRIEGLTKQAGACVLASEAVWRELETPPANAEALAAMPVKGVAEPVAVYKLA